MILSPAISDSKECIENSALINSEPKKQLVARWQTKDGKLICQWIRTSI
jgi:hypothetical protein